MGFPTCSSVSERALPEVGVNTATGDVLIAPYSLRRVTRGLPTRDEHRRLNVEITPSVQQRRNVIPGFAHARLAVSVDRSPRWSVFGRWWERLLDDVIDDDNPHVEQLGGIPRRGGHVICDDKVPRFECVYEPPLKLSFVLSIPAAIGGGVLAAVDSGLQGLTPTAAIAAFITAAIVGYLSIDLLLRIVERVAFWAVCIGLGTAAIVGGVLVI